MNHDDAHRALATIATIAAGLARHHGGYTDTTRALEDDASSNLRAANFSPGGPSSTLDDDGYPMPPVSDPTGDTVVDGTRARAQLDDLDGHIRAALDHLDQARTIQARALKAHQPRPTLPAQDSAPTGACRSCWRDQRYWEPIAEGQYAHACRWCGDFRGAEGIDPPLELVEKRHRGERITTRDVERAKANRHRNTKPHKAKR